VGSRSIVLMTGHKRVKYGPAGQGPAGMLSMAGNLACQREDGAVVSD
jgi:hypothetical protein